MLVRASVGESGRTTEWFDITGDDDHRLRHLLSPSRIHPVTRRLGGEANDQFAELTDAQLELIRSDTPTSTKMDGLPDDYVLVDDLLTRFASLYAIARWGDGVNQVQVRVGHRLVPPFAKRQRVDFEDVPFTNVTLGWRTVVRGDGASRQAFEGYAVPASRRASD